MMAGYTGCCLNIRTWAKSSENRTSRAAVLTWSYIWSWKTPEQEEDKEFSGISLGFS